jgi:hypothetical protein
MSTIGNLGAKIDLKVIRGADATITIAVTESGVAKDLTGYTASLVVKQREKSATNYLSLVPTISGAAGTVSVAVADTDTSTAVWNAAIYHLNLTAPSGTITRLMDGAFTLLYAGDGEAQTGTVTVDTANSLTLDLVSFDAANATRIQGYAVTASAADYDVLRFASSTWTPGKITGSHIDPTSAVSIATLAASGAATVVGNVRIGSASAALTPLHIGTGTNYTSDDASVLISRVMTGVGASHAHGFADDSNFGRTGGTWAYNSYDAQPKITGTTNFDHYAGFQCRPIFQSIGTIDFYRGFVSQPQVDGPTITDFRHFWARNTTLTSGAMVNQVGFYASLQTGATNNYGVYVEGPRSYFGGTNLIETSVGIGYAATATVPAELSVSKVTGSATIAPVTIQLRSVSRASDWDLTTTWGNLDWYNDDASGIVGTRARIGAYMTSVSGSATGLRIYTANNNVLAEAVKIDHLLHATFNGAVTCATTLGVTGATTLASATLSGTLYIGTSAIGTGSDLEIARTTGSATLTPIILRLRSTRNAGDWDTTNPWASLEYASDDVSGIGATVRARIGAFMAGVAGSAVQLRFFTSSASALAEALKLDESQNATFAGTIITKASDTTSAGLRLAHGAAPTSPTNGDMWTTTGGAFIRINGVTKTFTLT